MKGSILLLLAVAICSCAQNYKAEMADTLEAQQSTGNVQIDAYSDPHAKLIKTANYRFRVSSLKKTSEAIEQIVKKFPAHISSSSLTVEGTSLENKTVIRVQSEYFNDLLREVDKEAVYVHYRNIHTEDVAKQFVDLESRLKTKREVQERYKEILRTKAGKIEELLSAEKQIGELQEEIEATVSRLNYLKDQVAFSTINLEFYERVENNLAQEDSPIVKKFGNAFSAGLKGIINVSLALTRIWPLLVFISIAWIFLRKKVSFRLGKP
jgi:hypothetical protein